jgi:hypothetical protein
MLQGGAKSWDLAADIKPLLRTQVVSATFLEIEILSYTLDLLAPLPSSKDTIEATVRALGQVNVRHLSLQFPKD